ncbi:MAG: GNAT family N-acetyltransferase [Planktomarina sp.]|nr:GNAT family N-acetyltransferase [Planktomarina sp.]
MQKYNQFLSNNSVRALEPGDEALVTTLDLIKSSFAFMAGLIDPPSSVERLTLKKLKTMAEVGRVLVIGKPVIACVVATPLPHALYLGKIAVDPSMRGQGLVRALIEECEALAEDLGKNCLELQVRIELVQNEKMFAKLGFIKVSDDCHLGYDRVTEITMQKPVC